MLHNIYLYMCAYCTLVLGVYFTSYIQATKRIMAESDWAQMNNYAKPVHACILWVSAAYMACAYLNMYGALRDISMNSSWTSLEVRLFLRQP